MKILLSILLLVHVPAFAGQLVESDFAGVTPETFDGYDLPMMERSLDFGPFIIHGMYDSQAYVMPIIDPVVLPAIGGDTFTIELDPPAPRIGFHMGTQWAGVPAVFLDVGENVLASFDISDFAPAGSGPYGIYHQGFLGFEADGGTMIHKVVLGSGDLYIDNVYVGGGTVEREDATWSTVKLLFR